MFTRTQLVSFGNFLLEAKGTKSQGVTHAEVENWLENQKVSDQQFTDHHFFPSRHNIEDKVLFFSIPDDGKSEAFPGIAAEVLAVHFYPGKVKYDLDLLFSGDQRSRIYNVDSVLVGPINQ